MSEAGDAPSLSLPGRQNELIAAVAAANPHTVVVLITGNPVAMPWIEGVAGVLQAWYPGIGGGQAIANLLFGTVAPSGKLPITFARGEADLPHARVFGSRPRAAGDEGYWAEDKQQHAIFPADYGEGRAPGLQVVRLRGQGAAVPLGFGLTYTTFEYGDLHVDAESRTATFTLSNSGSRSGTEIAQLYVSLPSSSGEHFRRLAGWQRVPLDPGQRRTVTIAMEPLTLATFDEKKDAWTWPRGRYTVFVGGSSRSLPLKAEASLGAPQPSSRKGSRASSMVKGH